MIAGSRACACAYLPIHHHHDQAAASGSYRLCPANHENDGALGVALRQPDSISPMSCSEMPTRLASARLARPAFSRVHVTASGSW